MEKSMGLRFLYDQSQHSDERPGLERRNMNAYSSPKNLSHQKWCPCLVESNEVVDALKKGSKELDDALIGG